MSRYLSPMADPAQEARFSLSPEEIPPHFAELIDATKPLGDVCFLSFSVHQPENPRTIRFVLGGVLLVFGILLLAMDVREGINLEVFYTIAAALALGGGGVIAHAAFFMQGAPPVVDTSDVERRGAFFTRDAMMVWNGEAAHHLPRHLITKATNEGRNRCLQVYFYFADKTRWRAFRTLIFPLTQDYRRIKIWAETGALPTRKEGEWDDRHAC